MPLVLAALAIIYLPGLDNTPVFDDEILTNGEIFATYGGIELKTRMLSYGSFVWVHALFGDGWWKQRLVNVLLHVGVVFSLWGFYREMLRHVVAPLNDDGTAGTPYYRSPALGFAIAFFALNPVAVYGAAYLIQRSIVMATLFVVLGLWLFSLGLARRSVALFVAAFACYVLAIASKEHAVLAPLAAIPVYILVSRPSGKRLAILATAGTVIAGLAAYVLWLKYRLIIGTPFDQYSHVYLAQLAKLEPSAPGHAWALSIVNQSYLFFQYGLRWVFPFVEWLSINLRPPFPLTVTAFPQVLGIAGYAAAIVAGSWLLLRFRDGRALLGVAILMPALLFGTEFATVWVQDSFVLYRSYLWAIGIPGLVFFVVHGPRPRTLLIVGIVGACVLTWQALDRVMSMANPETIWSDAIRKLPRDPRSVGRWFPYVNRGSWYADRDQFELAMRDFEVSAALGDLGIGWYNIGALLTVKGKQKEALELFDRAEKAGYWSYNLWFQRGLAYETLGNLPEAYRYFDITKGQLPASPTKELNLLHLARTGLQVGKRDEAIAALEELLKMEPKNREALYLHAMALIAKKEPARAIVDLDKLLSMETAPPGYYGRAVAHQALGHKQQALADIDEAIRLSPNNNVFREWRAKIQAMP